MKNRAKVQPYFQQNVAHSSTTNLLEAYRYCRLGLWQLFFSPKLWEVWHSYIAQTSQAESEKE